MCLYVKDGRVRGYIIKTEGTIDGQQTLILLRSFSTRWISFKGREREKLNEKPWKGCETEGQKNDLLKRLCININNSQK